MNTNFGGSPQNTRNKLNASQTSAMFLISLLILCDFFVEESGRPPSARRFPCASREGASQKEVLERLLYSFLQKGMLLLSCIPMCLHLL